MEFMHNATFRILPGSKGSTDYEPGIYRVIIDEPGIGKTVSVLIRPEEGHQRKAGGRKKLAESQLKRAKRKKAPPPLVGELKWMERDDLQQLAAADLLVDIKVEARRRNLPLEGKSKDDYELRKKAMASFLDFKRLQEGILVHQGLSGLVAEAMGIAGVSRSYVYRQWSTLCLGGVREESLIPHRDLCGAPGVRRPCDPGGRQKAGRKTAKQRIVFAHTGKWPDPEQPGMSSIWAARIRAADKAIPAPKPAAALRCKMILNSGFCAKAEEANGRIELVKPEMGTYPINSQIMRVLTEGTTRLQWLLQRTTQAHFIRNLRGLVARNWRGVAGPNHTWAIDSTVGDIYLRSSVNRAWIIGRPIVYVIVDVWSTAVVGFYVCLSGPSWDMAKVALFNASADPELVGELWGYQPILTLNPRPTLCYGLLCDRGEYLSKGHRQTAIKLIPLTSYTPPYRGDLKGLVEVLHRIAKDKQFLFVPGAMDFRREELELRRVDPSNCVMTIREYVHFLYEVFTEYNLCADRSHRLDAHMSGEKISPSPSGLWWWGHASEIAFRRDILESDLVAGFLPEATGRVRRDSVRYAGCDYMSDAVKEAQWTGLARNFGGIDIPVHPYPGAMRTIWTPHGVQEGLMRLTISDQSKAAPELTIEEWMDARVIETMSRPGVNHEKMMISLQRLRNMNALVANAARLTADAVAKAAGSTAPTMSEARKMEVAAMTQSESVSESKVADQLREQLAEAYDREMQAVLAGINADGDIDAG